MNPKNKFLVVKSVCTCETDRDFYQHNSKANNNRKFKFSLLNIHYTGVLIETFYGNQTIDL